MYREFVAKIMEVKVAEINPPLHQRTEIKVKKINAT